MVMITRSTYRKTSESLSSDTSGKNNKPPWCSSGSAYERKKPRKAASCMKSCYPIRENIWDYLNDCKTKSFDIGKQNKEILKTATQIPRTRNRINTFLIFLILGLGITVTYLTTRDLQKSDLVTRILPKANILSSISLDSKAVGEECCRRMRHLRLALKRAKQTLSKTRRRSEIISITQNLNKRTLENEMKNKKYIKGARAFKGSNTLEWETKASLWGVVPLWRASPPPDIVLSLRRLIPSDCWPFRGTRGDIIIELPTAMRVDTLSLEHIYPDIANSAPKNFTVYGIATNGTWIKAADDIYQNNKEAKQYFILNNKNIPFQQIVFRVLSNQGNPKYTCVYRINLYTV